MKKITSKLFLAALIITAGLGLTSCKDDGKTLYIYNWTYYTPDSVLRDFEKEFDCKIKVDYYASNEEMYNKIRGGGGKGYDIVVPSQDFCSIMIEQGMLAELDQSKMTNNSKLNPLLKEMMKDYDPEFKYCGPYYLGAAGVAVNKTKVPAGSYERTWNIFADTQFKDHATMMDDMREVFGDALNYLGYSVNTLDDSELAKAKDLLLNKWKPNLVKFDAEGFGKSFASGDFWLCQGYAEVIYSEVPEEKWADTIDFFIPENGGPSYLDSLCILKTSKHQELANEFINYIHKPEVYAKFLDFFNFPCFVIPEAKQFTTNTPVYDAEQMNNCELKLDIGTGLDKYNALWQEIRFSE